MIQNEIACLTAADGVVPLFAEGQRLPFIDRTGCGENEQNAVRNRFNAVIDTDKIAFIQLFSADVRIVVDQAVRAALALVHELIFDPPAVVHEDEASVPTGYDR